MRLKSTALGPNDGAHRDQGPEIIASVGIRWDWKAVPIPPIEQIGGAWPATGTPRPRSTAVWSRFRAFVALTAAWRRASLSRHRRDTPHPAR